MGFTLDISVTRLRENDSIDIVLNSNTYTIDGANSFTSFEDIHVEVGNKSGLTQWVKISATYDYD